MDYVPACLLACLLTVGKMYVRLFVRCGLSYWLILKYLIALTFASFGGPPLRVRDVDDEDDDEWVRTNPSCQQMSERGKIHETLPHDDGCCCFTAAVLLLPLLLYCLKVKLTVARANEVWKPGHIFPCMAEEA